MADGTGFVELLDEGQILLVEVEDGDSIELHVEQAVAIEEVNLADFIELNEQGPAGPAGLTYVHTQSTPSASWIVNHPLNTMPDVRLFLDSDLTERVYTDITYSNLGSLIIELPAPATGVAYLK